MENLGLENVAIYNNHLLLNFPLHDLCKDFTRCEFNKLIGLLYSLSRIIKYSAGNQFL